MPTYNLTVPNKNGSYDGDMVVRHYTSLTISAGNILTTDQPCRGLLIYVQGNCTISGTLSMTARGAAANPSVAGASDSNIVDSNGLRFPFFAASGADTITTTASLLNGCGTLARTAISNHKSLSSNGTVISVPRVGGSGAGSAYSSNNTDGGTGGTLANGTGGGASGGTRNGYSGAGSAGTCFSGGSGGGGQHYSGTDGFNSAANCSAEAYGGAGGKGYNGVGVNEGNGGGAGNPGGLGAYNPTATLGNSTVNKGSDGTGGLLVLIVGGNLTINSGGIIEARGSTGGTGDASWAAYSGGGGSGGGRIILAYRGTYTNNGSVTVAGGAGGGHKAWTSSNGGTGGAGSISTLQIK
jgi:hypothetical protein